MIRKAGPFWTFVLSRIGALAIAMPWGRIYVREEWLHNESVLYHETIHIAQMKRDGRICFSLKYLWWLARYGYEKNPYEIEANRLEAERFGCC